MNKIITLFSALLLTLSISAQKINSHNNFPGKILIKRSLDESILSNKYSKYLPHKQNSSNENQFKKTDAVKQQLDMVYSANQDKDEFRYDSKGNIIEDIYYEWYANQWERRWKSEYTYDDQGNNTQNTVFNWDEDQWVGDMKYEYAFDSDGNKTQNITYTWNGSEWQNEWEKEEFAYDDKGNLSQYIVAFWIGDQYMNSRKIESKYDDKGNQTQNIRSMWENDQWISWFKDESLFNDKKNQTLKTEYEWDGAQWVNTYKSEYIYNANDQLSTINSSEWDGYEWINTEIFENFYDSAGNISRSEYSLWEEEEWVLTETINYAYDSRGNMTLIDAYIYDLNLYKEESVYDDYDNRIEYSIYEGDWESGLLRKSWKTEGSYDNNFSFEDLILPFTSEEFEDNDDEEFNLDLLFNHKLMRLVNFEGDGENWLPDSDYILEYSEQNITGLGKENFENRLSLYPNPASREVTFTLDKSVRQFHVKIFDIEGKIVISRAGENNKPFSLESLSEGIYFYQLESPGDIFSGKFLVKN